MNVPNLMIHEAKKIPDNRWVLETQSTLNFFYTVNKYYLKKNIKNKRKILLERNFCVNSDKKRISSSGIKIFFYLFL